MASANAGPRFPVLGQPALKVQTSTRYMDYSTELNTNGIVVSFGIAGLLCGWAGNLENKKSNVTL